MQTWSRAEAMTPIPLLLTPFTLLGNRTLSEPLITPPMLTMSNCHLPTPTPDLHSDGPPYTWHYPTVYPQPL